MLPPQASYTLPVLPSASAALIITRPIRHSSACFVVVRFCLFPPFTVASRGGQAEDFDDLSGAQELALGELVAQKFGSDFFFLDRFPTGIRPFYTMPCPDDKR